MRCPCCSVPLKAQEMFRHVWLEHRLLLDGDKARPPWELLGQWVREYRRGNHATALSRCRALAAHLDPRWGPLRFECLLDAENKDADDALGNLQVEAMAARVSLCPRCFGFVPTPVEHVPYGISFSHGRISAHGYMVEVSESGLVPRLVIESPSEVAFRGREPGRWLTYRGGLLLIIGPLVLLSLVMAVGIADLGVPPIWPVVGLCVVAALAQWVLRFRTRRFVDADARALTYAWSHLVPRLHDREFSIEDSAFLAGLALTTTAEGAISPDKETFQRHLEWTEKAALKGAGAMRHLGALWRLAIHWRASVGLDLGQMIAGQVQRCLEGPLSLEFVEGLLAEWEPRGWAEQKARVRVLVCERAFEAGFEIADLLEAGETSPSLGRLVGRDAGALAQLRLLWSLRPSRPWDRFGSALTAFEVADQIDSVETLAVYPDLLLLAEVPALPSMLANGEKSARAGVALCAGGVHFQDVVFTEFPRTIEVLARPSPRGRYELVVGERRFHFGADPEPVAGQLERWLRYYFGEFRPQVQEVGKWPSPDLAAVLRARGSVTCAECRCVILPRPGELALSLDAYEKARSVRALSPSG
jgi:hypothetical protein